MPNYLVRNQTPDRLQIAGASGITLNLAPLQRRRLVCDPEEKLGPAACRARTDHALAWEMEPDRSTLIWVTAWLTLAAAVATVTGVVMTVAVGGPIPAVAALLVAVGCLIGAVLIQRRNRPRVPVHCDDGLSDPPPATRSGWQLARDVAVGVAHGLFLLIVLGVGILLPATAIYYGTELSHVFDVSRTDGALITGESNQAIVVGRGLQIVLVMLAAVIPGLMYFQFDREKLTTLVDRWLHHVFRLDATMQTIYDVDAKYGRRVEEFYGTSLEVGAAAPRRQIRSRSPVFIATVLMVVGWIVVLLNSHDSLHQTLPDSSDEVAGVRQIPNVVAFFEPSSAPTSYAFLGAYFFAIQVVLRGYVRGDLRPKTYNMITVRILMAVILAWIMQGVFGVNDTVLVLAFLGGLVPDTVLRRIRDVPQRVNLSVPGRGSGTRTKDARPDDLDDRSPLTDLDGIDIYERTRLAEEGITNIQALARHDLIDLMLSSRIPAPRLIDWVDQALLYQHVTSEDRKELRRKGIRTATELLAACRSAKDRDALRSILGRSGEGRLPLIQLALQGDEWLSYVQRWRDFDDSREPSLRVYTDEGGPLPATPAPHSPPLRAPVFPGRPPAKRRPSRSRQDKVERGAGLDGRRVSGVAGDGAVDY